MRLRLEIAGGVAAPITSRRYVVDSEALPPQVAAELARLVDQARSEPRAAPDARLRDAMTYELTIQSPGAEEHTLVGTDGAMPPGLRALIRLVRSLAAPPRPPRPE